MSTYNQQQSVSTSAVADAAGSSEKQMMKKPKLRMQKDEAYNFLRLATALKILMNTYVETDALVRAEALLKAYLLDYKKVREINIYCDILIAGHSYMARSR